MAQVGLLPVPDEKIIRLMVEDFKERHRTGKVDLTPIRTFREFCDKFGGGYERYSCDNSSPTSILDQMINILDKARANDCFIPWQYLFADYSISGLDASRQGYGSYKSILADENHMIQVTYVDDFTRASRDEMEWWRLGALSKRLGKGMIGASDGFDLSNPNSDILITVFGLVSRLFIKGLREKVTRGMRGAARRGTCLGKLSLGFTRRVHRDQNGNIVCGPDGLPLYESCFDPATQPFRVMLYELFVIQGWSPYRIARHFNKLKVDDWIGWTGSSIKNLLGNPSSIGVFIWNRQHQEFDPEEERWVTIRHPHSEWEVYYDRNLAIIPMDLWRAAQRKLAATRRTSPLTGRKRSRNEKVATTLFSGTLFCEHCLEHNIGEAEIKLIRSTPKYKQMGCLNGITGVHNCPLSCSKSTEIIEDCLFEFICDVLLTKVVIDDRIAKANAYLEQEAQKPQVNTAPMKAKVRTTEAKLKKLFERIEDETDEDLCKAYDKRIKALQKDLDEQQAALRSAEPQNGKKVKALDPKRAEVFLASMRALLNQEVPMAAEAIRTLTGPIKIRQEPIPGRKTGARWIATFSPDFTRLLQYLAKDNPALSGLVLTDGKEPQPIEVVIDKVPKYERLAPKFKELRDKGASVETIAHAHGMSWQYANEILHFADTGQRPKWRAGKRNGKGQKPDKYKGISAEVARLRDKEKMPFTQIAIKLGVGVSTVRRAYDFAHADDVLEAAQQGEKPSRGKYSHLGEAKCRKIRKLLGKGMKPDAIAAKVHCGPSSVVRIKQQMQAESDGNDAA
jgi:DNA invertase Pin-like site-specific DNA recombinase